MFFMNPPGPLVVPYGTENATTPAAQRSEIPGVALKKAAVVLES